MLSSLLYVLAAVFAAVYYLSKRRFDYWKKRNVPYLKPTPIFGNYIDAILLKKHLAYVVQDLYKKFPKEPYFGTFYGTEPTIVVKDPEILKLVTTKDFYYFSGREASNYVHKEEFTQNLFSQSGNDWKVVRQNLTPVFTSAKMKNMFPLITKCAYEFEDLLDNESKMSNEFKIRPLVGRFTMACIASCAFGVDSQTLGEKYKDNPFTKIAEAFFSGSRALAFKFFFRGIWPAIFYALRLKAVPENSDVIFKDVLAVVFESRKYKPTSRNDFVDFIMNFRKNNHLTGDSITNLKTEGNEKVHLPVTDDFIMAQCLLFYIAGFETSATTTSFTMYELAKHPEAQKKVQAEVDAFLQKHGNKLTYDVVNEMPYTWACVEEALRLYPVLVNLTREVMEDYTLPSGLTLEKGVRVHIPVYDLHRDPQFFPEPEVYRPERFLGDERRNIIPYSYMPFGEGSRICIGMRFAKMQVMAGIVTLMKKYTIELADKTPKSFEFNPLLIIPTPYAPFAFKATPRVGWENRMFERV